MRSASEPRRNLAPRLDRRDTASLGSTFISSCLSGRTRAERPASSSTVAVCSRAVSGGFCRRRPQSRYCSGACAAAARRWRRVKASRRYRASVNGACVGVSRIGAIGNGEASGRRRPRWRRRRQLAWWRCARVSAQRRGTKIFASGCVTGRAAMSPSGSVSSCVVPAFLQRGVPLGVTARAGSRGTLSTTASALATRTSDTALSASGHLVSMSLQIGCSVNGWLKCSDPKRRKERAGSVSRRPPVSFLRCGGFAGRVRRMGLGRRRGAAGGVGSVGAAVSALSSGRSAGGGGDGGVAAALGSVVAGGGVCAGGAVGVARRLQASGGGAAGAAGRP